MGFHSHQVLRDLHQEIWYRTIQDGDETLADNYLDQKAKKWKNRSEGDDDSALKRAYVSFCMEPVIRLWSQGL